MSALTREELLALPAALDVLTAARVLDVSPRTAYDLIRLDEWPTPVLRLGRQYRIPTEPLLAVLGITQHSSEAGPATGPALALAPAPADSQPLESA